MTPYKKRLNKYIKRMAEDMQLRNFADATIDAYTYHADKFCQHFGKTADKLGPEQFVLFMGCLCSFKPMKLAAKLP